MNSSLIPFINMVGCSTFKTAQQRWLVGMGGSFTSQHGVIDDVCSGAPCCCFFVLHQFSHKRRWQPLMESDGLGYISFQEHVTPHIGMTARFFGFNSTEDEEAYASRHLDPPRYK